MKITLHMTVSEFPHDVNVSVAALTCALQIASLLFMRLVMTYITFKCIIPILKHGI